MPGSETFPNESKINVIWLHREYMVATDLSVHQWRISNFTDENPCTLSIHFHYRLQGSDAVLHTDSIFIKPHYSWLKFCAPFILLQHKLGRPLSLCVYIYIYIYIYISDRLCALVVRVPGYRSGGPGFDSRALQIKVVGLERGLLSLVSTTEQLLGRNSSGPGLESREYGRRDSSRWLRATLYPQKSWH
jgi:hypothetical protein